MIGYLTLGTADLPRAAVFYDLVLGELGATRARDEAHLVGWRFAGGGPGLYVLKPYDGNTGLAGNGGMIALRAGSPSQVHAVYEEAIACGGTDEGKPGPRSYSPGFYAAYFRDPDGNKLNVFCFDTDIQDQEAASQHLLSDGHRPR